MKITEEEIVAIKALTIDQARLTFEQDFGSYDKEDNDYIQEKRKVDAYCEGVEDALKIIRSNSN